MCNASFSAIERESAKMGLAVNEAKTKYMLTTSGLVPRMGSQITANSYNFDLSRSVYTLAPPLTQTRTSAWKSSAEKLLPTGAMLISIGN